MDWNDVLIIKVCDKHWKQYDANRNVEILIPIAPHLRIARAWGVMVPAIVIFDHSFMCESKILERQLQDVCDV